MDYKELHKENINLKDEIAKLKLKVGLQEE
jgi:hypothetical protein